MNVPPSQEMAAVTRRIANARTLLFAPGHRPERFAKAVRSGADVVVLDLEDSVPDAEKPFARAAIEREWPGLRACGVPVLVRVNSIASEVGQQDLIWLARAIDAVAVMVPKVASVQALARIQQYLGEVALLPIIESSAGYAALPALAASPGVLRLVVGHLDFVADTGIQTDGAQGELVPLRFAVAVATRLNQLAPAVDGVTMEFGDDERVRQDVQRALRFGFGGKLCIHPREVSLVHQAMLPTQSELEWARRVLAASDAAAGAAVQLDGRMVDLPVVLQARRTVARAATPLDPLGRFATTDV